MSFRLGTKKGYIYGSFYANSTLFRGADSYNGSDTVEQIPLLYGDSHSCLDEYFLIFFQIIILKGAVGGIADRRLDPI